MEAADRDDILQRRLATVERYMCLAGPHPVRLGQRARRSPLLPDRRHTRHKTLSLSTLWTFNAIPERQVERLAEDSTQPRGGAFRVYQWRRSALTVRCLGSLSSYKLTQEPLSHPLG